MNTSAVRVMIVDDHEMVRRGVRSLIQMKPRFVVVGEACDGEQALTVAKDVEPDIAILDYTMPKANGITVAKQLKQLYPKMEIILFTIFEQDKLVAEAVDAGILGLVLKSQKECCLLEALESVALRRQYHSPSLTPSRREHSDNSTQSVLTTREREIVRLIAEGRVHKQIAFELGISIKTVETHRTNAMNKLQLSTTAELVRYAIRNDLVTD